MCFYHNPKGHWCNFSVEWGHNFAERWRHFHFQNFNTSCAHNEKNLCLLCIWKCTAVIGEGFHYSAWFPHILKPLCILVLGISSYVFSHKLNGWVWYWLHLCGYWILRYAIVYECSSVFFSSILLCSQSGDDFSIWWWYGKFHMKKVKCYVQTYSRGFRVWENACKHMNGPCLWCGNNHWFKSICINLKKQIEIWKKRTNFNVHTYYMHKLISQNFNFTKRSAKRKFQVFLQNVFAK